MGPAAVDANPSRLDRDCYDQQFTSGMGRSRDVDGGGTAGRWEAFLAKQHVHAAVDQTHQERGIAGQAVDPGGHEALMRQHAATAVNA